MSQIEFNAAKETPRVVIAIVATDEVKNIVGCLKSLGSSSYREFRVIVNENGGCDAFERDVHGVSAISGMVPAPALDKTRNDRSVRRDFHFGADKCRVSIIGAGENRGYSGGVNDCIAAAGKEWDAIWVLNPDTFPEADAMAALVRRQREGGYGIVGSKLVFVSNGMVQLWGGLKWRPLLCRCRSLGFNQPSDAVPNSKRVEANLDIIAGTSMFVTREYIEANGVMDEDFFVYFEDVEWSLRRGKFSLGYAHESVVHHVAGATSGSGGPRPKRSRFSIYLTERNRVLIARKRFHSLWQILAVFALLQTLEYLVRFRSPRSFGIATSGWWAGLRGETGMPGFMRGSQERDRKAFLKRAD